MGIFVHDYAVTFVKIYIGDMASRANNAISRYQISDIANARLARLHSWFNDKKKREYDLEP